MAKIRRAAFQDAGEIFKMLVAMHGEASIPHPPIEPTRVMNKITELIATDGAFLAGVEVQGRMVTAGTIGLAVASPWFSDGSLLGDFWFYVKPKYRTSRAAFALIECAKQEAQRRGLPLQMGDLDGNRIEAKGRFFERAGLTKAGGIYRMEV